MQVLQLFEVTDNLKLSERHVHSMLEPLLSSKGGSKLIMALLQERTFLLNMVKAMLLPGTPTLAMLIGGKVSMPTSNESKIEQNRSEDSILLQYNHFFNRRENVQVNFNFREQSDSDDSKADAGGDGSDGSIEDLDGSLIVAQKQEWLNGMANLRYSKTKQEKEQNNNFNNQRKEKPTSNQKVPKPQIVEKVPKPQIAVKKKVEIPQFDIMAKALDSPVAQAYKPRSKPPTQENSVTMNASMVKGNYPTSTSTALEVSPDTKMSQANQNKKTADFATDQFQNRNSRPRQPVVFTQEYMNVPFVRVEKKVDQEVKKQEIKVEPLPKQKTPQLPVAFSFFEIETKQPQVQEPERIVQKVQTNALTQTELHQKAKSDSYAQMEAFQQLKQDPQTVKEEIFKEWAQKSLIDDKPLTQPSANKQNNYMELSKHQPITNQPSDKLTGRGVEFDFNFQNTDDYIVTEEQKILIGDEDDFFEGKLTNITQARESEVAEQIQLMDSLKQGVQRVMSKKSAGAFVDTRLVRKQSVKAQEVKQPAQQRPPPVVFEQEYTKADGGPKQSENKVTTQQNPMLVSFEPVDNGFEESPLLKIIYSEETPSEQPRRNVFDEGFNKIKRNASIKQGLQSEEKLLSEPKQVELEVTPETPKSNKSSIHISSQKSQAEEGVELSAFKIPDREWGQLDFQPSSSSISSKEEDICLSGESIDEQDEIVQTNVIEAAKPKEPVSVQEESIAQERRNIFNAGSESEFGTNRTQQDMNLLEQINAIEDDLFDDLHQFER